MLILHITVCQDFVVSRWERKVRQSSGVLQQVRVSEWYGRH